MELLSKTAKKEDQIAVINYLVKGFDALLHFADGNEQPLDEFRAHLYEDPPKKPPVSAATPITIERSGLHLVPTADPGMRIVEATAPFKEQLQAAIAADTAAPSGVYTGPDTPCTCEIAVKEKDGDPYTCLKCKGNAYTKHYVFAHTEDGKRLLSNAPPDAFDNIEEPVAEYIAIPAQLMESTDEDRYDIEKYA